MERLEPLRISPATILDLGAATGSGSRALGKRFRQARIISGDISMPMLQRARAARRMFSKAREVQLEASRLPLRDDSVDLVVANMLLPWVDDLPGCLQEVPEKNTIGSDTPEMTYTGSSPGEGNRLIQSLATGESLEAAAGQGQMPR